MSDAVIEVGIDSPLWQDWPEAEVIAEGAARAALAGAGIALRPGVEVGVSLADDARLRELNRDWRGQDKPTNVLSFPAAEGAALARAPHLGDIAIAYETLAREADEEGKSLAAHLAHLVVHGVLHLLGHDHEDEAQAEAMEALERRVLAGLGHADPYAAGLAEATGAAAR